MSPLPSRQRSSLTAAQTGSGEVEEDPDEGVLSDVEFEECEDARRAETEAERLAREALAD